jgi:hypothetical protein
MGWRKVPECVGGFVDLSFALREQHPNWPRAAFDLDSPTGQAWLADAAVRSFTYQSNVLTLTVRKERVKRGDYWYAYARRPDGTLAKRYVGQTPAVTTERLYELAVRLTYGRPVRTDTAAPRATVSRYPEP